MTEGFEDVPDMAEINATPLIDVLLVLLIMVMISLPLSPELIGLGLAASSRPEAQPHLVRLSIGNDDSLTWNGESLSDVEQLDARLDQIRQTSANPEIHLGVGADAHYGRVAAAMAAIQRHGIERIALDQRPD